MKKYECITPQLQAWIGAQKMFFVGSAPLTADGHVNISPKGLDCLRVMDDHTVCYMDMTGSGNETSAHVTENGRLTLMFCAFAGAPRILRLYGTGRIVLRHTAEFSAMVETTQLPVLPSARQIVVCDVHMVTTSCGYAVPKYDFVQHRSTHTDYVKQKALQGDPEMEQYQQEHNLFSLDGLVTPLGVKHGASSTRSRGARQEKIMAGKSLAMVTLVLFAALGLASLGVIDSLPSSWRKFPETALAVLSKNK